jgi:cyanophycin synthetase
MNKAKIIDVAQTKSRGFPAGRTSRPSPMRLLKSAILRGCNVHYRSTVIRQEVDLGGLEGVYSRKAGHDFAGRFLHRFFDLRRMVPGSGMTESFLKRLNSPRGVLFEEVLFEAILAVETSMAYTMRDFDTIKFAKIVRGSGSHGIFLVWECKVPKISRDATKVGLMGLSELLPEELHPRPQDGSGDFRSVFAGLQRSARRRQRSTTTAVLALAAKRRGLPCESLGGPYLRLGHGVSQHVLYASVTEHTSLAASQLSRNKRKANRRLAELCLPVPRQTKVATAKDALLAAETIGYPVVIKPLKDKQAFGVSVGIKNSTEVTPAFERARKAGSGVIVESFVQGQVYRLLVVGGHFVAALKTVPPTVTGDGKRTILELVEALNSDPLRDDVRLEKVKVDDELTCDLALSGCGLDDVLEEGKTIAVRLAANVGIGGVHTDVTDSVHPDNQEMAIRATEGIGLDIAGVDFITEDISRSYKEAGGSLIEINARPALSMHTWPGYGKSRNVGDAILALTLPPGGTGRIPTVLVAGERGTVRVAWELDAILRTSGKAVGLAARNSAFVNGQVVQLEKTQRRNAVRILLRDPRIETLVSAVSLRQTIKRGLALDTGDVAAIMNHAVNRDAHTFQQALQVVVKATRGILVVSARNKLALEVMSTLEPKRLVLLSSSFHDPIIVGHVAAGGAVVLKVRRKDRDWIVLYRKDKVIASISVATTHAEETTSARRVEARMFAVGLAFGLGLSGNEIETAPFEGR